MHKRGGTRRITNAEVRDRLRRRFRDARMWGRTRSSDTVRADECIRVQAITRLAGGARVLAVERDRADRAAADAPILALGRERSGEKRLLARSRKAAELTPT